MYRSLFVKAASVATLSLGAVVASSTAALAQDQINFEGAAQVANAADPNLLAIDFLTSNVMSPGLPGTVMATQTVSGVFAGSIVPGVTTGSIADLTLSAMGLSGGAVNPFVTLGGYTFNLTSTPLASGPTPPNFGPVQLTALGNSTIAGFAVNGTVTAGPNSVGRSYTGIFTTQFAGQTPTEVFNTINNGSSLPVSFSANFVLSPASTVPEPSTYALLATGISALGMIARRRRQQA